VVGAVDLYRDEVQVSIGRPADLIVLDGAPAAAPPRPIGRLSAIDVGALVAVEGSLAEVAPFSAGVRGRLTDGSGTVTLLLWQDYYDSLPPSAVPGPGDAVRVQGRVAEYRGELEIVPELPGDVLVLSRFEAAPGSEPPAIAQGPTASPTLPATPSAEPSQGPTAQPSAQPSAQPTASPPAPSSTPTPAPSPTPVPLPTAPPSATPPPTPAAEIRPIASITADDVDRTLTVELAGIAAVDYLSKGVKYTLTDASGSIALLIWQDVLEEVAPRHDLLPGSQVRVTGRIDQYQGELEIVPRGGDDVTVVDRGGRPPVEERAVADIAAPDEGRVFTVQGALSRIEGRGWLRLWLHDGTGEMLVFCPERLVPYLPPGLGPGTPLRVTGEVEIYQGSLELVPLAGADVEVR
jgi:DNA/RNA endonuclease YhcR with UshA esterase domain